MNRTKIAFALLALGVLAVVAIGYGHWRSVPRERAAAPSRGSLPPKSRVALTAGVKRWVLSTDEGSLSRVRAQVRAAGGTVDTVAGDGVVVAVSFPDSEAAVDGVTALDALQGVEYVEPDLRTVRAMYTPSDSDFDHEWGMSGANSVHADQAWDVSECSADVVIAVVDTGVDADHPDLKARVNEAIGTNFVTPGKSADDDHGHGSHVAGIAAASIDDGYVAGVAPRATIMPVKVLDSDGWGYTSDVAAGVVWAADNGADVINMSLGSSSSDRDMAEACAYAISKGVSVVAAAGNDGDHVLSYPAAYPDVIGVSAIDSDGSLATFSNYGDAVDICAPGVMIRSVRAHGTAFDMSGTSMATPFVAGAVAMARASWPGLSRAQAEAHVLATAEHKRDSSYNYFGAGLVDVNAAVRTTPNPDGGGDADVEFPGRPLGSSAVTGTLGADNTHDVFAIKAYGGQRIFAQLTQPAGADFTLSLCPPGSSNADVSLARSAVSGNTHTLSFVAPKAGTYYLCVEAQRGEGDYVLTYRPGVVITAPTSSGRARRGVYQKWSGRLYPKHTVGHHDVYLRIYRRVSGTWRYRRKVLAHNLDSSSGTRYSAWIRLPYKGRWRVVPYAPADSQHIATVGTSRVVTLR